MGLRERDWRNETVYCILIVTDVVAVRGLPRTKGLACQCGAKCEDERGLFVFPDLQQPAAW